MLSGQAVVAIWNGIGDAGRAEFYAWHLTEHMPERVGIPGFKRGRRYRAVDRETHPEFFTLYEVESFEVLQGVDYANRLNAPTAWTKLATAHFKDTVRGLARVIVSAGPGPGGALATVRFAVADADAASAEATLGAMMAAVARRPMITGAHLCRADRSASAARTTESQDRRDLQAPPDWFVLVEACTPDALDPVLRDLRATLAIGTSPLVGRYLHEYTRLKTDWSPG